MQRQFVSSSNLRSVGYDHLQQILEIEFHNGGIYQYFGVPEHIYSSLMAASSHGSYFHAFIRESYRYRRVG
jgi:hypothetical protein